MASMKTTTDTAHKPQPHAPANQAGNGTTKQAGQSGKYGPAFTGGPRPAHERYHAFSPGGSLQSPCDICGAYANETCLREYEAPSTWLDEGLHSHSIYDSAALKLSFNRRTGKPAPNWPEYTAAQVNEAIDSRGLGGEYVTNDKVLNANGWEIANAVAYAYAREQLEAGPRLHGRGFQFRAAIEALRKAGL